MEVRSDDSIVHCCVKLAVVLHAIFAILGLWEETHLALLADDDCCDFRQLLEFASEIKTGLFERCNLGLLEFMAQNTVINPAAVVKDLRRKAPMLLDVFLKMRSN
jgi:hypothetical protein